MAFLECALKSVIHLFFLSVAKKVLLYCLFGNEVIVHFNGLNPKKLPILVPYQGQSVPIPPYPYKPHPYHGDY